MKIFPNEYLLRHFPEVTNLEAFYQAMLENEVITSYGNFFAYKNLDKELVERCITLSN